MVNIAYNFDAIPYNTCNMIHAKAIIRNQRATIKVKQEGSFAMLDLSNTEI